MFWHFLQDPLDWIQASELFEMLVNSVVFKIVFFELPLNLPQEVVNGRGGMKSFSYVRVLRLLDRFSDFFLA